MKLKKIRKESLRRTKSLKTKLCHRNFIKRINLKIASLVRYSKKFLKSTKEETQINRPRNKEIDDSAQGLRLHVLRKEGRALTSIEDCLNGTIQEL